MQVSKKIHRVLYIILGIFLAILLRIWHLGVVQREEKLIAAERPRQRTILLRADRGGLYDRFHLPLAINKITYNAAIYYGQLAQIPTVIWKDDGTGKRVRSFARKEYIRKFSKILAKTLDLDWTRVEDLIYAKASLFPHAPFVLKAGISEKEHYRLKALEKDWLGIHAEITSSRHYPLGKTACHLIGTMGAINAKEYETLAFELKQLQEAITLHEQGHESALPKGYASFEKVYERLFELKEKAYSLTDLIGKTGCEAQWEEELRGFFGKKTFEIDQKGRICKELPGGRVPISGKKIVLSISSELQQFAEKLLEKEEKRKEKIQKKQPLLKGGAIVVLDPNSGEVLAMASCPCFDPNDFIPSNNAAENRIKQQKICHWLENESFISSLWEKLSWDSYLDLIFPLETPLKNFFQKVTTLKSAIQAQEDFEALLYFSKAQNPLDALAFDSKEPFSKRLSSLLREIDFPQDRLFAIDLCRLAVDSSRFPDALIEQIGSMKISEYRSLCQEFQKLQQKVRSSLKEEFGKTQFQKWKEENQKEFLAEKRREEKAKKAYAKPYLDYLDQKEKELFQTYWEENRLSLLVEQIAKEKQFQRIPRESLFDFLRTFRSYEELNRPLLGRYRTLRNHRKEQTEKDLAAAFYPLGGNSYLRSFAFQSGAPLGSLFKLVTAYEGLRQKIPSFSLIDEIAPQIVSYSLNRTPYPRIYKGGRLPRSSSTHIGKINLLGAIEQSSNPYFSILAGDFLNDPEDLAKAAYNFGFGEKTGIDLPGETKGKIPSDLKANRTGLYSFAIGQHTFLSTPLQGAVMLAAIANGGKILKPKLLLATEGFFPERDPMQAFSPENTFAKRELEAIGISFPLFTKVQNPSSSSSIQPTTEIRHILPFTSSIRAQLLKGMDRSIWGEKGNARPIVIRSLAGKPEILRDFLALKHQMVGKTSTAELLYNPGLNPTSQAKMHKHIWFGAISFESNWNKPELVVVVFSRYGDAGKELAPIAAQIISKWRSIRKTKSVYLK